MTLQISKNEIKGSDLTRAMLKKYEGGGVHCVISDESDEAALNWCTYVNSPAGVTLIIKEDEDGTFVCKDGNKWKFAVPVDLIPLSQKKASL